jgi:FAD/FMN-containing dehydrogenase
MASIQARLAEITGPSGVLTSPDDIAPYLKDWRGLWQGTALAVVRPANTTDASKIIRLCLAENIKITLQGGNTGLVGGSVPGKTNGIVLQTGRLVHRLSVDQNNATITVGAGVTLETAQTAAAKFNMRIPVRLGAEGTAQIGGLIATNAGGSHAMRFGMMRAQVLGLRAVLPNGDILDSLSGLRKNNYGPDLKQLFIGSEGAFGLITAATLALQPAIEGRATALVALSDLDALPKLLNLGKILAGHGLERMEFMGHTGIGMAMENVAGTKLPFLNCPRWCAIVEIVTGDYASAGQTMMCLLEDALEQNLIDDAVPAASNAQAEEFWHLREAVVEGQRLAGPQLKHDVSVAVADLPELIQSAQNQLETRFPDCKINPFGHAGDGNIHFNISTPNIEPDRDAKISELIYDLVVKMHGSIAAEHGLGRLKRQRYLKGLSAAERLILSSLRQDLDPGGIFNSHILREESA